MFTHYTMTIRFADGNTRYSALVDGPGLLDFGSRYGVGVAINTETGEADCIAVAGDVFTADVENLTGADLAAPGDPTEARPAETPEERLLWAIFGRCPECGEGEIAHSHLNDDGTGYDCSSGELPHPDHMPDGTLATCDRCGMPAVKVAGQWLHTEYADAAFCAIVMRGMA